MQASFPQEDIGLGHTTSADPTRERPPGPRHQLPAVGELLCPHGVKNPLHHQLKGTRTGAREGRGPLPDWGEEGRLRVLLRAQGPGGPRGSASSEQAHSREPLPRAASSLHLYACGVGTLTLCAPPPPQQLHRVEGSVDSCPTSQAPQERNLYRTRGQSPSEAQGLTA